MMYSKKYQKRVLAELDIIKKLPSLPETNSLNFYSVIKEGESPFRDHGRDGGRVYCMARLRDVSGRPRFIVSKLMKGEVSREYLNWLLGESSFSKYYLADSYEEVRELGGVVVRCDIPANLMMMALQLFRYSWEFPSLIGQWTELCKEGLEEHDALIAAHFMNEGNASPRVGGATVHHIFDWTLVGTGILEDFKNLTPPNLEENYCDVGKYISIQGTWSKAEGMRLTVALAELIEEAGETISTIFGEVVVKRTEDGHKLMSRAIKEIKENL